MSVLYALWVPELRVHIRGAEDDFLEFEVAATVRDYMNRSGGGEYRPPPITTVADQADYPLNPPTGTTVLYISGAWRNNILLSPSTLFVEEQQVRILKAAPNFFDHPALNVFRLVGGPILAGDLLYLETRLGVAAGQQTEWPFDDLGVHEYDDILCGTQARLYAMPDKPWTNEKLARYYLGKFNSAIAESREFTTKHHVYRETPFRFPGGWR